MHMIIRQAHSQAVSTRKPLHGCFQGLRALTSVCAALRHATWQPICPDQDRASDIKGQPEVCVAPWRKAQEPAHFFCHINARHCRTAQIPGAANTQAIAVQPERLKSRRQVRDLRGRASAGAVRAAVPQAERGAAELQHWDRDGRKRFRPVQRGASAAIRRHTVGA